MFRGLTSESTTVLIQPHLVVWMDGSQNLTLRFGFSCLLGRWLRIVLPEDRIEADA
jgi:hypothetical protein